MADNNESIFDKIGGKKATKAAADLFYDKALSDVDLKPFFNGVDVKKQKVKFQSFLVFVLGGPEAYKGKDMGSAHAHLIEKGLNESHFMKVAGHLNDTLTELNVPTKIIEEIMAIAASTKDDILQTKTDKNMALGKNLSSNKPDKQSKTAKTANQKDANSTASDVNILEEVLEQAVDSVVSINSKKEIIFYNQSAEKMFGYTKEEVLGKNVKMIVPTEHQVNHDSYVQDNIDTKVNKVVGSGRDLEMVRKNGSKFWGNLSLSKVEYGDNVHYTAFIKDITELIEEKERNVQILEQAVDSVVTINSDRIVTFFNKSAEKMFGYSREEVIGQNVKMIVPVEHQANHDTYVNNNIETGVNKVVGAGRDLPMTRRDGTKFWGNLSLSKVEFGNEVQYTAFIKDITDQVEEKIRNVQILEQAVDSVVTINSDRIIQFFNKAAEKMFGYSREEVIGQNVKMIVPVEHQANHDSYVNNNIVTGVNKVVGAGRDLPMTRRDGTKFWGNLSLSKVELGDQVQYTAFIKDITAEVEEKERNVQILEQAVDSVVTINSDRIVQFFNKAAEKMFGYSREEVIGQNVKMIVPVEHRANHDNYVNSNITTGVNKVVGAGRDLEMTRRDGSKFWGNLSLSKVEFGGQVQYTAFIKDITEEVEEKLKNKEILEQALDSVVTIDSDRIVTFFNRAAEKMFGFKREEVLGQNVKMIVPVEHRSNHDNYVNANIETGVNKVVGSGRDLEMTRKDGSKFWGNLSLSKVEAAGTTQFTAFIKDITLERESKMKAQQIQSAVDNSFAAIEFNVDGIIQTANDNFLNAMGYKQESEIVGQHHKIFCESEHVKSAEYRNLWSDLKAGKSVTGEFKRVAKDGSTVWLNASYTAVKDEEGIVIKVIKIAADISKVKLPVIEVSRIISQMAEGNLTDDFNMASDGYVKEMGDALNKALNNLNGLLSTIDEGAQQVANSAERMMERSQSMKSNTTEVASAISQMSKGAQDQASRTDESSKLAEEVMSSAVDMESKANLINKAAAAGQKSSESGLKIIRALVENMTGISASAGLTSDSIQVLTERAEEIARTLNVITDIASQTNLLALNAAIEAARAGEAGRGFAVVAEEIRKLAEDSRKSAVDIEKIIKDVQKDTQSAGKAIETMEVSVKQGNSASIEAESIFQEIAGSSDETFKYSLEIQDATTGQKKSIDTVVKNIEQIVVVAEETAAGTQEVASSSQELDGSMEEIAAASDELAAVATELQAGVNQFTLKKK